VSRRWIMVPRLVPYLLGAALLGVTLFAAAGASGGTPPLTASTACVYANCPTATNVSPIAVIGILGLLALVAIVLGVFVLRDRRRGPRKPPAAWSDTSAAASAGGPSGPSGPGASEAETPEVAGAAVAGGAAAGAAAAAAAYTETPEDVAAPLPEVPTPAAGGASDIDSLMAELDRISGEILKRGQTPKKEPPSPETEEGKGGS